MSEAIVKQWLAEVSHSVATHNIDAHLDLISQRVQLTGVPGFAVIDYNGWAEQCKHEFAQKLIARVDYRGLLMRAATANRMMFKTYETVTAADGSQNGHGIEVLLEKEPDGKWRVLQERILPDDETRHDGFLPV